MEIIHCQGNFLQKKLFGHGNFPQTVKFYTVKEIFHKKDLHDQRNFLQTRKFSTIFFSVKSVFHKQTFLHSQKKFCKQQSKRFCKKFKIHSTLNLLQKYFNPLTLQQQI